MADGGGFRTRRRPRAALEKYQNEFSRFVKRVPKCAGWMEMGSGKTASTLTAIVDIFDRCDAAKVLVIAPLRVAMKTWPDEIDAWEHTHRLRYMFLQGNEKVMSNKIAKNLDKFDIFGVSCDSVHTLAKIFHARPHPFDWIVIDEASRFKNMTSKRTMSMKIISIHTERLTELTGTPAPNGLKDVVSQVYMLDRGKRLGSTMAEWRRRFCQTASGTEGVAPSKDGRIRIMNAIKDVVYVLRPEDFNDVKRPKMNFIQLDMTNQLKEDYARFKKDYVLKLPTGEAVKAMNAAGLGRKLLQYACIGEGTEVLTDNGWKPIERVSIDDRVWNGEQWANSFGSHFSGYKEVIECDGVMMTPDHKVLTESGWAQAKDVLDGKHDKRLNRKAVRLPDGFTNSRAQPEQERALAMPLQMRERGCADRLQFEEPESKCSPFLRVLAQSPLLAWHKRDRNARGARPVFGRQDGGSPTLQPVDKNDLSLPQRKGQGLQKLWSARHHGMRSLAQIVHEFFGRYGAVFRPRFTDRQEEQQSRLFQKQLPMGDGQSSSKQHASKCAHKNPERQNDSGASRGSVRSENDNGVATHSARQQGRVASTTKANTYDVVNVQPGNCFTVRSKSGKIFIAHNSGAMYDAERNVMPIHDIKVEALKEIIEDNPGKPVLVAYNFKHEIPRILKALPQTEVFGKDPSQQDRWNRGEIPILLAHPKSAAHGLNLQYGGHVLVWFSFDYNLEEYLQMNKRLARKGQKNEVMIHHLIMNETIDVTAMNALRSKDSAQTKFQEDLQQQIMELLAEIQAEMDEI